MESAWQERRLAGENSSREWEALQDAKHNHQEVWDEYGRIRDYNNPRIESLRYEADHEHQEMQNAFDRASSEYEYGDKSMAPVYAQEGRDHKERRDELNSEMSRLCAEVRDARQNAEWRAPSFSSAAFHLAKEAFDCAKAHHETAQAEFKRLKAERDRLKVEFDSAQAEHLQLKGEFQGKLEEIKTNNKRERDRVLDKASVRWSERNDAKIVKKSDGTTQIYHGGFGKGDGYGHGHITLDSSGHKTYDRDAFAEHGQQNFIDEKTGWTHRNYGITGDDHEVTFSVGTGKNSGQPLKCVFK